jgi:hypothetical protein
MIFSWYKFSVKPKLSNNGQLITGAFMSNFKYFKLDLKLKTEQFGTCPDKASVIDAHLIKVAMKEIKKINKNKKKLTKLEDKYVGADVTLTDEKQKQELIGVINNMGQSLGTITPELDLNDMTYEELLDHSKLMEAEWEKQVSEGKQKSATIFMKDENGWPKISTHMIVGNLKEIARNMTNNSLEVIELERAGKKDEARECKYFKSKTSIGEMFAQDCKVVEDYAKPSMDILRKEDGSADLFERPVTTEGPSGKKTCLVASERVPAGAEYTVTLRVRSDSPLMDIDKDITVLEHLFDHGKSCGLGAWRGSGQRGAYFYNLEFLPDYVEPKPEGKWK